MKKKIFVLIISLIAIIAIASTSYAYLKIESVSDPNKLTLSNFGVILLTDIKSINVDNLYPTEDYEGLLNPPTTFQIQNVETVTANYKVSLIDKDSVSSNLNNSGVRYQLKRTSSLTGITETLEITNLNDLGIIDEGVIQAGEIITYELIMWIDYDVTTGGLNFSKVILVEGMQLSNLDTSGANYPELAENMIPIYYEATSDTEGVWKKADSKNLNLSYQWFDYENYMWANAATVKENGVMIVDKTEKVKVLPHDNYTLQSNGDIYFDGVDDYLNLGYEHYDFPNTVSMVLRFNADFISTDEICLFNNFAQSGFGFTIQDAELRFQVFHEGVGYIKAVYDGTLTTGTWYTVVGTYDGNYIKMYLNGSLVSTVECTADIVSTYVPIALGINSNLSNSVTNPDNPFKGIVSDAMLYQDVITADEVATYFSGEISSYPQDNALILFDQFIEEDKNGKREVYLNARKGTEISMDDITTMWVWIPRYKYAMFTGLNEPSSEQLIEVTFEHGIDSTGTVRCVDNILTADDSASSETCTDSVNGSIIRGKSTYTHPAFTFGSEELTGFWMAKFEMSTDDETCINTKNETNCDKIGLNVLVKPGVDALNYQGVSTEFANIRRMEIAGNIHGFPQNTSATSHLDSNSYLTGEIANDNNTLDIHMQKNMEWGAVAYLSQSRYGKWNNSLYTGDYRRVYKNNYYDSTNDVYKTGYSSGVYNKSFSINTSNTFLYNDMTITATGQGYRGAGASNTGSIYGVYDMNGGIYEYVMGNQVNSLGYFYSPYSAIWATSTSGNIPDSKYYDKYSYNITSISIAGQTRGKLGDGTKEVITTFESQTGGWGNFYCNMPYSSIPWFTRGGGASNPSYWGIFNSYSDYGDALGGRGSRPVLVVSRDLPWLSE